MAEGTEDSISDDIWQHCKAEFYDTLDAAYQFQNRAWRKYFSGRGERMRQDDAGEAVAPVLYAYRRGHFH